MNLKQLSSFFGVFLFCGVIFGACQRAAILPDDQPVETSDNQVETSIDTVEDSATGSTVEVHTSQTQTSTGGTTTSEQSTAIEIEASNYAFSIDKITASEGTALLLTITSTQGTHDFVIEELGVSSGMLPVGEPVQINVPTDRPGTYEFYCSVGNHREMGMKGTLVIR